MIDGAILGSPFLAYSWFCDVHNSRDTSRESALPGRLRYASELLSFALAVQAERGHTPGFRRLGLRVVDPRTGAELDLATALARVAVIRAPWYLVKRVVARSKLRERADQSARRLEELEPQLKELRAKYKDDAGAQQAAIMALYKQHAVNPLRELHTGPGATRLGHADRVCRAEATRPLDRRDARRGKQALTASDWRDHSPSWSPGAR